MTIQIDSFNGSFYDEATNYCEWDITTGAILHYPGLVVGVSIFGSATVTQVIASQGGAQNLTFVRGDTNGLYRSEIWYLSNLEFTGDVTIGVYLSASADVAAGACVYNYFGGVGANAGRTGYESPLVESSITPTQINSILFGNLCTNSMGAGPTDQNERWIVSGGIDNHGFGCDKGPLDITSSQTMNYEIGGTSIWVTTSVELLDYQPNPAAIMGFGM